MSEESAPDPRSPKPRNRRGAGVYIAYSIAGALLLGAGALSVGHLARRPGSPPAAPVDAASRTPPAPAQSVPPSQPAQAQEPSPSAAPKPAPSVTVSLPPLAPPSQSKSDVAPAATPDPPKPTVDAAPPQPATRATPDAPTPAKSTADAAPPEPARPASAAPMPAPAPPPPLLGATPGFPPAPPAPPEITKADGGSAPINLIAANGLPLPPPEKPPVPGRRVGLCPPGTALDDLVEASPLGPLPRVAPDGCAPWLAYATAFDHLDRQHPRLGIAVIGIGMNEALTQKAVETLPAATTLVFVPDTPNLDRWIQRARERGLEALLLVPGRNREGAQEPSVPPVEKGLAPAENLRRLRTVLAKAKGYVGVALLPGPVLEDADTLRPMLTEIRDRGLLVLELERWSGKSLVHGMSRELGLPYSTDIDRPIAWIDRFGPNGQETTPQAIDSGLGEIEKYVKSARFGLAWSLARPLAIDRIAAWAPGARLRGFVLAPVTGVTECGENCQKRLPRVPAAGPTR